MADKIEKYFLIDETRKYFLKSLPPNPIFQPKVEENIVVTEM